MPWGKSLKSLKNFSFERSLRFLQQHGVMQRNIHKAYKFFCEGFVNDMWTLDERKGSVGSVELKAKCYRSQKKNKQPHQLHISFSDKAEITQSRCSCEAGASSSCNHIVALCYTIQHLILRGYKSIPEEFTCTDLPQQWNRPRGSRIDPEPLMNCVFTKITDNKPKSKAPTKCTLYNACLGTSHTTAEDIQHVTKGLLAINQAIPFAYLLNSESCNQDVEIDAFHDGTYMANCCTLQHQLKNFAPPVEQIDDTNTAGERLETIARFPIIDSSITQNILLSVPPQNFFDVAITLEECYELETTTRLQSSCEVWHEGRKNRFTASKFAEIFHRKKTIDAAFLTRMLTRGRDISHIPAISHGRKYEKTAIELYCQQMKNVQVLRCGLVVNPFAPFLGASPDGHLVDHSLDKTHCNGVLEVKCPLWDSFEQGCTQSTKRKTVLIRNENDELVINPECDYFCQVQGQMLLCGVNWCDFVVYLHNPKQIYITRVDLDPVLCMNMFSKLNSIYITHALPFVGNNENLEPL